MNRFDQLVPASTGPKKESSQGLHTFSVAPTFGIPLHRLCIPFFNLCANLCAYLSPQPKAFLGVPHRLHTFSLPLAVFRLNICSIH